MKNVDLHLALDLHYSQCMIYTEKGRGPRIRIILYVVFSKQNSTILVSNATFLSIAFFLSQLKDTQRAYKIGTHFPPETLSTPSGFENQVAHE